MLLIKDIFFKKINRVSNTGIFFSNRKIDNDSFLPPALGTTPLLCNDVDQPISRRIFYRFSLSVRKLAVPFVRYSTAIHFSVRKLAVPFVKSVFLFSVRELAMPFVKSSTVIHFSVRKLAVPFRLTIKTIKPMVNSTERTHFSLQNHALMSFTV